MNYLILGLIFIAGIIAGVGGSVLVYSRQKVVHFVSTDPIPTANRICS